MALIERPNGWHVVTFGGVELPPCYASTEAAEEALKNYLTIAKEERKYHERLQRKKRLAALAPEKQPKANGRRPKTKGGAAAEEGPTFTERIMSGLGPEGEAHKEDVIRFIAAVGV